MNKKIEDIRVVYVEDETSIRELVTDMLGRRITLLYTGKNGTEGLELFKKIKPEIVITDIRMPEMDGLEMSRKIKEISSSARIIITSAYSEVNHFIEAIEIGVDDYVLKPISRDKLFHAIYKAANSIWMQRKIDKQFQTISKLYSAIEQSQGFVVISDKKKNIEYLNPRFTEITGYTPEEVLGENSIFTFEHLCDLKHNHGFRKVLETGNQWRGEYSIKHKEGHIIWLYGSLCPVLDEHGEIVSYVQVGDDISEIRQMAANLADKEDKLRNLIEKLGEGIAILDLTYDFVYCNAAMEEIFECNQMIDSNLSSFIRQVEEMKKLRDAASKLKIGEKLQIDISVITAEKNEKQLSVTFTPQLNDKGMITGLFCIFKDITQIKELIEELQSARDAAEKAFETIEEKNQQLNDTNQKLKQSETKLSELNEILMEYIKATGK
ncbi:MAG: PAS domain S-box protein [Bacteroidota bacterium]